MPHTRRALSASDVLRFNWDSEATEEVAVAPANRSDFERIRDRFGE